MRNTRHCRNAAHIVRVFPQPRGRDFRQIARGPVAQWLEPAAHNGLVAGSSPAGPTTLICKGRLEDFRPIDALRIDDARVTLEEIGKRRLDAGKRLSPPGLERRGMQAPDGYGRFAGVPE
jgi:hypothetical protein